MDEEKNRWPFRSGPQRGAILLVLLALLILSPSLLLLTKPPSDRIQSIRDAQKGRQWLLFEPELDEPEVSLGGNNITQQQGIERSFMKVRDLVLVENGEAEDEPMARSQLRVTRSINSSSSRERRFLRTERKPILNEFSFPANLVQGMRFMLMCQVLDGEPPIQIKWFKDNEELITSPDSNAALLLPTTNKEPSSSASSPQPELVELITNDELGASLLFRRIQQQHSGNYTCLATNQYGSTSYSSFMSVKVPPSWKVEPQDQHSIMGDQITIDCQATGNPNPFIRWKFTSVQQQQQQQHTTHLGAPQTSEHDATAAAVAGASNGNIVAPATNLVAANFKLINSNHHVQTLENGSLTIRQAQKEHEGFYLCEADNGVEPNLVKALRLVVHLQAQFADELQVIDPANLRPHLTQTVSSVVTTAVTPLQQQQQQQLVPTKLVRLALGTSQMRILCQPLGDPPMTLEWLKDGQPVYTHTTPADLSLLATKQQQPRASGGSSPDMSNYHVSTRRSMQRPLVGLDSELVVTSIRRQDAGIYTCLARNAYGQSERRLRLIVQEPPEPPEMVDVAHIGSRSIALRWLAPFDGNSPIVKYTVEYRRQTDSSMDNTAPDQTLVYGSQSDRLMAPKSPLESQTTLVGGTHPSQLGGSVQQPPPPQQQVQHSIHELEPLTSYSMRVVAVNAIGRSRPSVALSLRTDEEVPSVVPSLVEAFVLSSKSIKLRWSISYSPAHEIIDGFFVGYRSLEPSIQPAQSGLSLVRQPLNSPAVEQPTFTYKTIRLTNQQQQSQQQQTTSADLQRSSSGDPESHGGQQQQQHQGDSSSAFLSPVSSVTKTLPAASMLPFALGHPTSTGVSPLQQQHQPPIQSQQVVVVSAFEYVINGLDRNTEYTILIQCFNRKGAGPTSDPVVFKTFMNDPPEKLILSTDEIKESSLRLSWRFGGSERFATLNSAPRSQEPVDGFVLTFAKVNIQNKGPDRGQQQQQLGPLILDPVAESFNRAPGQPAARISNQQPPVDQWQALQLSPQQRSHQLKNLECGTAYVMKIWAFNKIGNGEASDLITVRTQAPIAPEKRAFISINSTQLRLHLSAWYDGGCEIDKFIVQYRLRGQQEWLLVSNNILKEQASVIIRDLTPATSYEILIAAHNQVATTEARYRVVTLDTDGKPVSHSFLSGLPSLEDLEEDQIPVDYTDPGGARRSERWPQDSATSRSLAIFRNLMNSPMALILSLCLFVVLIMVLLLYKFNSLSQPSNSSLNSQKSSGSGGGGGMGGRRTSCDATGTMLDSDGGPLSLVNESPGESPQLSGHLATGQRLHGFLTESDCQYQSFCHAATQQQPTEYGRTFGQDSSPYPAMSSYGTHSASTNYSLGPLSSAQRSATMEPNANAGPGFQGTNPSDQRQQQQQCLVQMLMMGPQQQQQQQIDGGSYVAALTTMARGHKNNSKQQLAQSNNNYITQGFASANTLGRHTALDYQRLQQQHQQNQQQPPMQLGGFSGKQQQPMSADISNLPDANHHQSNNFSMATIQQQSNHINESAGAQRDELYPMSTFTRQPPDHQTIVGTHLGQISGSMPQTTTYCGSSSTTISTSGCGTASSSNGDGGIDQTLTVNLNDPTDHYQLPALFQQNQELNIAPTFKSNEKSASKQIPTNLSSNSAFSHQLSTKEDDTSIDLKTCDKPKSQYDVPFKFMSHTPSSNIRSEPEAGLLKEICY